MADLVQIDLDAYQFWTWGDTLRGIRRELDELQTAIRADSSLAAAIGPGLTRAESLYGDVVSRYQQLRVALGMGTATGLGAAWNIPVGLVAVVIAVAAAVTALAYMVGQLMQGYREHQIMKNARARQEAGDPAGAQVWLDQLRQSAAGLGEKLQEWLGSNWPVVAMALAGVVVATSGKGRR